jgi:transcriptional regulator with XRE-family HTH domain
MNAKSIGERIKQARAKCGYTQLQLSEKVFISESYIALIELGNRNPSMDVLVKISEVLGVTLDYLVFGLNEFNSTSLYKEWENITQDRTPEEIKSSYVVLREFFNCIDANKNK